MENHSKKKIFVDLIEANQGIIFKVSRMYCDNEHCRKDLFQEILLQLWRSFETYNQVSKFSTWMYRVALNTAISQFRKTKKGKEEMVDELPINIAEENNSEEQAENALILHKAINKLNKVEKSIIILYMEDCTYEEISEIAGISVSNVGVKINRIKAKLQKILKELGYGL